MRRVITSSVLSLVVGAFMSVGSVAWACEGAECSKDKKAACADCAKKCDCEKCEGSECKHDHKNKKEKSDSKAKK